MSLPAGFKVEALARTHDRAAFSCGVHELDNYLQRQARQDVDRHIASVFVLTSDSGHVVAFYTLSALAVLPEDLPVVVGAKLPRFPLPVTLLGRMAVDKAYRGSGLGRFVLMHALQRALHSTAEVASWAVVVDTKVGARDFYLKYGFIPLPNQPDRLFLPMREIEKLGL